MISLTIKDTKTFMSHLLIKDTFDNMLLSEAAIVTGNTYNINGSINRSFFSDDELHSFAKVHQFHIPSALPPGSDIVLSAVRMPTFGVSEEGIDPVKSKTEHLLYLPTGKTS